MIRRVYGASAGHAALMLAGAVVTVYAAVRWLSGGPVNILEWLAGSVIGHDLLLLPGYAAIDRLLVHSLGRRRWLVQYIRVPVAFSSLLLAVWWPLILRHDPARRSQTGLSTSPFLGRWLAISGLLFAGSAAAATVSVIRRRRSQLPPSV
jgi:hypothetical protein